MKHGLIEVGDCKSEHQLDQAGKQQLDPTACACYIATAGLKCTKQMHSGN